jgi:hypothetical protein
MAINPAKPMSNKKDTVQFLTRPRRELVARLDDLARQYKRESGNQLMVEIAEMYTEMWIEMEKARRAMFNEQWARLQKALTLPIKLAEAEPETKQQTHGRKSRK